MKLVTDLYFIEAPKGELGFYGFSDTCLPTFFTRPSDPGSEYSVAIITLNLSCFIFIAVSYILARTYARPKNTR